MIRKPYLHEREFWRHAAAVDVCINLRYPSAGETSGIAMRLMSMGKPVIVTAGEEYSRFPKEVIVPINPGLEEEEMLAAAILALARDRMSARLMGAAAREYLVRHHTTGIVARRFVETLVDYN